MTESYSASDIVVLTGLEAVRRRPGMYIDLQSGIIGNHLVKGALCHAIEELALGRATKLRVELQDDRIIVEDNGLGWSGEPDGPTSASPLEQILTQLLACRSRHSIKRIQKEICGVGLAVVNALSSTMTVRSWADGQAWQISFEDGDLVEGPTPVAAPSPQGFILDFMPNQTLLPVLAFDVPKLWAWWQALDFPIAKDALEILA